MMDPEKSTDGKGGVNEMAKKENRFEMVLKDGSQLKEEGICQILVDRETGVHYLAWKSGYAGGITPLLDEEGHVVVRKDDVENND